MSQESRIRDLITALGPLFKQRVRVDSAQGLTQAQQLQARQNIGIFSQATAPSNPVVGTIWIDLSTP